ncbi:MAG: C39 family peptidase [Clostridia bacterium]|jgi:hypothetical protein|nr:C39 family peptidase [Clostridia bacterium]
MINGYEEFKQNDNNKWSNIVYHKMNSKNDKEKDTIANTGCGPTSLAIIISKLIKEEEIINSIYEVLIEDIEKYNETVDYDYRINICIPESKIFTPDILVAMATLTKSKEDGIGQGSYDEVFRNIVDRYFYNYLEVVDIEKDNVINRLKDGDGLIAHSSAVNRGTDKQERSMFASNGHYMTIVGTEEINGELYVVVNDPYVEIPKNSNMIDKDYLGNGLFRYVALIDPKVGNCDKFWEVKRK